MKRKPTEASLCMERILVELFGNATAEYQFALPRKWAYDFFVPMVGLAVEIEGLGGRHQSIGGFIADIGKYNASAIAGHSLLRFTTRQALNGEAERTLTAWKAARA